MDAYERDLEGWLQDDETRVEYGTTTLKYNFAFALTEARKLQNLTQIALARIAGVSQAYIARLESGEANPTIGRVGAILASIWTKPQITIEPLIVRSRDSVTVATSDTTITVPAGGVFSYELAEPIIAWGATGTVSSGASLGPANDGFVVLPAGESTRNEGLVEAGA